MADADYILYKEYSGLFSSPDARDEGMMQDANKNKTWGSSGAGLLILSPEYQEVLLFKRSREVQEPFLWGITGGARKHINHTLEPSLTTAVDESRDEMDGLPYGRIRRQACVYKKPEMRLNENHNIELPKLSSIPLYQERTIVFSYKTYILEIDEHEKKSFIPKLNWEHTDWRWFNKDTIKDIDLHPGVQFVLDEIKF